MTGTRSWRCWKCSTVYEAGPDYADLPDAEAVVKAATDHCLEKHLAQLLDGSMTLAEMPQ